VDSGEYHQDLSTNVFYSNKGSAADQITISIYIGECEAGGPVSPHPCEDVQETEAGRLCDLLLNSPGLASCRSLLSPRPFHEACRWSMCHTANEGLVRIQYKCLVPIYVFLERKLLFPKQSYNVLSPSSTLIYTSVRDLYISRIGLPILLQENMWTDPQNI
jgi:hypothetical protein